MVDFIAALFIPNPDSFGWYGYVAAGIFLSLVNERCC
jgi:hypothetical protein